MPIKSLDTFADRHGMARNSKKWWKKSRTRDPRVCGCTPSARMKIHLLTAKAAEERWGINGQVVEKRCPVCKRVIKSRVADRIPRRAIARQA